MRDDSQSITRYSEACPPTSRVFPAGSVAGKRYENQGNTSLLRLMPEYARRILDVGCGVGDNARLLAASGYSVDGIKLSEAEAESARRVCNTVFVHDLETGLPPSLAPPYDAILCSHVLEHLRWPDRLLRQICTLLKPQAGVLLVALPNILFYKNRFRLACGYFEYEESGLMDATHFRWFTHATSRRMVEEAGFNVLRHEGEGSFPIPLLRRLVSTRLSKSIDTAAVRVLPGLFAYQILILAQPNANAPAKISG